MTAATTTAGVVVRLARPTDTPFTSRVFAAAVNELYRRRSVCRSVGDDSRRALHDHLLRTDPEGFFVAERDGRLVAFGAGIDRGPWWFLSALFVLPEEQGAGLGGRLFQCAAAGRPFSGGVAATITNAIQPVSNTLYGRRGLSPWLPLVAFCGTPRRPLRPDLGRFDVVPLGADGAAAVAAIDRAAIGTERGLDHAWYLGESGRRGWLFLRAGHPAGYVYVSREGAIGPAAALRPADMELLYAWALAQATAWDPDVLPPMAADPALPERSSSVARDACRSRLRQLSAIVPGPCVAAQRVLWEAGLRFGEDPGLLLVSRPFGRFDRYGCGSFGLM